MIFNLLLLENLGLSSLTMVKSCKISPFTSYKFFFGRYLRFTMLLGHLFFGCILGGRLWNAGPIFLALACFFFHVWLEGVFSGSRLKSERSMDSKSACEMFLLMFFAGSHFPRIKRGGLRSPGTKWRFPVGKFIELRLHWGKPCDARRHNCSCLASLLRRSPKEARTERCNPGY